MRSLTWEQVRARRLARNHLLERAPPGTLVDVVADVCGIHAQVGAAAELAIAARVAGVTQREVREALWKRRELVKAPTHRGTLHLHPTEELPLWKAARRADPHDNAWWFEKQGISLERRRELEAAVDQAVSDRPLTRAEVAELVVAEVGEWAREPMSTSWNFLLPGPGMCYGPDRGRNVTFVRFEAWAGRRAREEPGTDEALRWAAGRFLRAYAPCTPAEFAHWFRLDRPDAEGLFATLDLEQVELEGRRTCVGRDDPGFRQRRVESVRLLPSYDAYVIAAHPRDLLIPQQRKRIFDRGAGPFPALLVDGVVVGTWRREMRGRRVEVRVEPFVRPTRAQRAAITDEAERIGSFLGLATVLEITD